MKLLNGITTKGTALLGLDWKRDVVHVYDPRTSKVKIFPNIEEAAAFYPGCSFVFEATAESFELFQRKRVLCSLEVHNIDAYVFNTRYTKNFRLKHDIEKSDSEDAKTIYRIATETKTSLHRFGLLRDGDPLRSRISEFVIADRSVYKGETTRPFAEKYFGKILTKTQRKKQGKPSVVPEQYQECIYGSGGKYRAQVGRILFVAEEVRKENLGYREFRRQLGNYDQGFGSIMRSEVNWWWNRSRLRAAMKAQGLKAETKAGTKNGESIRIRTWPEPERLLRREVAKKGVNAAKFLWQVTASPTASRSNKVIQSANQSQNVNPPQQLSLRSTQ